MLEKRPLSLRNSDLFLKFKLTNGNKEEKYIENVKSLISKKGPSIGESNHLKSFHALSLLTPLPSSSYFNKTITFSPFSYNVSKSYVKDTTLKKATTFKSNNQNNNQETQDQKLKHKSTQVGDTYPLRYKFQTKLSSISFELNYLRTRESKAGLKEDDQRLSGRPQNIAEGAHPFVQAKELFDSNFKQIKSSSKHQFSQLGAEIVHNSKPEKNNYFSLPNVETKQNNIKLSSVQNVFKLNFYSLYFKSFLYNLNRGVCSGISQKFSIIAINLILFGVITIVQRSYYGKISFAINKKSLTAKLCASKLPNLTMWHEISTNVKPAGMFQNEVGVVKKPKHVFLHPKPKQMAGSFLGQLYLSSYINNDLERTNFGLEKPGLTKALPLSAVQKAPPVAQTLFVRTKAVPLSAPVRFYKALQAPVVNGKQTNFLYQKKGCQFEQVGANNLLFTKLSIILLPHTKVKSWYVDNKTLLSTKHYKKFSFKHKFEVNSNLQENQLFVENKENQIDGSFTLGKKGYVMKPWYYIKSTNFCDNKTIAARSIKQAASHNISYQHPLVPKYQYYIPYNISQQQIIVENDTIPEKRDSINSQIVVKQTKLKSSCLASELVLKTCFYKYGFFFTQFNELDQRTHSNSTVQSERESHFFRVKTLTFLERQLALKGQQENNQINGSTVNNYIIIAPYKRRTISFFKTDKKKTSAILKSTLPEFLSKNKMSFVSFMPIESRTKEQSFNKKRPLNEVCLANTIAQETKFVFPSFFYKINNLIKSTSTLLVNKNRASDRAKVKALQKRSGTYKAGACTPAFLSSGLTWSRYDLEKLKSINFIQVKDGVSTLNFKPDTLIQNTSVSGYQFSELRKKEIATLFRKIAIFGLPKNTDISLHFQAPASNIIFNGQHQINKKPRLLLTKPCKNEVFARLTKAYKGSAFVMPLYAKTKFVQAACKSEALAYKGSAFVRSSISQAACKKPHFIFASPDLPSVDLDFLSKSLVEPKMQYTQINLDEVESVKELFEQIGRDYEDYIRQPKDSLPALIISPSLEEDREIEEEGIRIFRKRDLLKRKNLNGALTSNSKDRTFIDDFSIVKSQDGEKQNHQTLVKNALQQAQEEIDDIAKKEEKSGEKDKQVIPPLTRLEALYTIRQREKKYEQAKNLRKDKGNTQIKFSFTNKSLAEKGSAFVRKSEGLTKAEPLYAFVGSGFEQLFLYSDKLNTNFFSDFQVVDIHAPQLFSRLGDEKGSKTGQSTILLSKINKNQGLAKTAFLRAKPCKNEVFARLTKAYKGSAFVMPLYAQTKFVQSSDRKHSFFGEMSLPAHKLTAKKQKQVFEQKGNPLVKLNTKNTELKKSKVKFLDVQAEALQKQHFCTQNKPIFLSFHSTVVTIPFTLLSSLSISSKTHNKKLQSSKFKVGTVKTHIVPPLAWQFEDATTFQPHVQAKTKRGLQSLAKTKFLHGVHKQSGASGLNKNMDWEIKPNLFNWMRGPNRIYFYDNLSQNKGCQGSTPKIKGTPLGSPVYHRVWQAKRIEPSSFRVLQRGQNTPVVPKISQNDWKNIIGWQLKKHFFEEDKRLWSLDNTNKKFKIKKVNLYLPWICITKASDSNTFAQAEGLPLTRSQLQKRCFGTRACKVHASGFSNSDIQLNCQTTRYWRLPTKRNLLSINPPKKRQTYRRKQSSTLLIPTQYIIQKLLGKQNRLSLQSKKTKQNKVRGKNKVFTSPQFQKGVVQKGFKESFLFESVTGYSWLFIYAFVSVLMFKQLFKLVYQAGLKDFFIKFLNSDFGRTITSEEFRYSIQNIPLKEFYTPKKRLQEFFSIDQNKVQLLEIVWFLRNHCQGRHGPRGVLLVGPPGVENVSVVQAIAGEAKVPIIVQSLEKIAQDNEPQRQLEQLYIRAHKHAPCVLFLDQLDTIGARRDQLFKDKLGYAQTKAVQEQGSCKPLAKAGVRTHSLYQKDKINLTSAEIWAQQTGTSNKLSDINTSSKKQNLAILKNKLNVVLRLLTILDGITQSSGVVTVATARDITKLDPALLRPKRFDRRIYLSLPNRQDRIQLFKIQTRNIGHIKEMPWDYLSLQTENMSTADIQSAINYSLFKAVLKKSVHTVETLEYGINCVKTLTEKRVTVM